MNRANLVAFALRPEEADKLKGSRFTWIEPIWLPLLFGCHKNGGAKLKHDDRDLDKLYLQVMR